MDGGQVLNSPAGRKPKGYLPCNAQGILLLELFKAGLLFHSHDVASFALTIEGRFRFSDSCQPALYQPQAYKIPVTLDLPSGDPGPTSYRRRTYLLPTKGESSGRDLLLGMGPSGGLPTASDVRNGRVDDLQILPPDAPSSSFRSRMNHGQNSLRDYIGIP